MSRARRTKRRPAAHAPPALTSPAPRATPPPGIPSASTVRGELGAPLVVAALGALAIAAFLSIERLAGTPLECGPIAGCDRVQASAYALVGLAPVALAGMVSSAVVFTGAAGWWLRADRRWLAVAYVAGLASVVVLAYLTLLEALVIEAFCSWCLAYAGLTLVTWAVAVVALRRTG